MADLNDMKSVTEWARLDGLNYTTAIKRRGEAGVGTKVGSGAGTWLLTRREWEIVKRTPLPGCAGFR